MSMFLWAVLIVFLFIVSGTFRNVVAMMLVLSALAALALTVIGLTIPFL